MPALCWLYDFAGWRQDLEQRPATGRADEPELAGPFTEGIYRQNNGTGTVAYSNGNPYGVFAVAKAPENGLLNEAMYTTTTPLPLLVAKSERISSAGEKPIPGARGRYVWKYYDDDGDYPIPPGKLPHRRK